jgi:methyl-accepting chemotaxis protein
LSQTTQQNASSSEELAATAEEMSSQAMQLQQLMSFFKVDGQGRSAIGGQTPAMHAAAAVRKASQRKATPARGRAAMRQPLEITEAGPDEQKHFVRF